MQHSHKLLKVLERDLLRRELSLKAFFDVIQTRLTIEHAKNRVFFFMKAEIVQPDRLFDHPIRPTVIALLLRRQIGKRIRNVKGREVLLIKLSASVAILGIWKLGLGNWKLVFGLQRLR